MYNKRAVLIVLLLAAFLLVSCADSSSGEAAAKKSTPATSAEVPRIGALELKQKLDAEENLVVVDSRTKSEYDRGHIPGAISIPVEETRARYGELSKDAAIVTYCT